MRCPDCRTEILDAAESCPSCSTPLRASSKTSSVLSSAATSSGATTIPRVSRSRAETNDAPEINLLRPGQAFGARYHIIRTLGVGGMGAVYQAWDTEIGEAVAIKVIRPEARADQATAQHLEIRFKRELQLARHVTHKNVVRIHDIGEIDGIKYITMSYIQGEDLATVLKREGALPVPRALRIMRQIVSGLVAAHEAGVIHRDLKPANIMIEGEHALIMDFGIAQSSTSVQTTGGVASPEVTQRVALRSTITGAVIGTVAYMAPEQARGDAVDKRADIYALGLIAAAMLVGPARRPEQTLEDLRHETADPPTPLRSIEPAVPEALEQVVLRCLQRAPQARYQATTELEAALARLDDNGRPLPLVRRLTKGVVAAAVLVVAIALGGTYYATRRALEVPVQPDPVSIVIADVDNATSDPAFDRTLEPVLKRALEGAGFITAYDRDGIRRTLGVPPPEHLDATAARSLAANQGLAVVLAGSIESQGRGRYGVSLNATQAVTGEVVASTRGTAPNKDEVPETAARLVARIRRTLGDPASESAQMFAMTSVSTTSLEVVSYWVAGRDAASRNDFDEAIRNYSKAVELDPKFGLGYAGLANVAANRTDAEDATRYITEALRYVDGMTERERYTTRASFYRLTGDYPQCVREYSDLLVSYPADVAARNNLAICLANLRDFGKAFEQLRQVVAVVPNRALYRINLASFANFSSDFRTAEEEVRKVTTPDVNALVALAFAQLGQGQLREASATYGAVAQISDYGESLATSGLGDLANIEGRFGDATRILEQGAAQDLKFERPDWAAAKLAALAHTELRRGRTSAAIAAADAALMNDDSGLNIRFMAARAFAAAGAVDRAQPLIAAMAAELLTEPRAYAKIVEGEIALQNGDARLAIDVLTEANELLDTWLGRFTLGRAYFEAGQFAQADSELERCLKRRGEALQLILGDEPTFAYVVPVYYYQGRVREGLGSAGFVDSYRQYLDIRGNSTEDRVLSEIRTRMSGSGTTPPSDAGQVL